MTTTGTLLVIDGADGAGKATQTKLLVERLRADGLLVETMSFPGYERNVFGKLIKDCLLGQHGDFAALDPRIASTLYAADRFESRPQLVEWLNAGKVVVLDRYVSSNMLHQGSKMVENESALREFLAWNDHVEHVTFGMPRPEAILYLDVPFSVRAELMAKDAVRGVLDVVEKDEAYQKAAEDCAKQLLASLNNWQTIGCTEGDTLKSIEKVHELVYAAAVAVVQRHAT